MRANARSTGAGSWSDSMRAAPTRTSFTSRPSLASAWLTLRTQAPQCIPSIRKVNSAITPLYALMIAAREGCRGAVRVVRRVLARIESGQGGLRRGVEVEAQRDESHAHRGNPALLAEFRTNAGGKRGPIQN